MQPRTTWNTPVVGRCSDYLHLVLFEGATEKQHDVTDILIGAWFNPGSLQAKCSAVGSPRIVGTTPSRWLFQDPQRLDDHVQKRHGQTGSPRITEGLEEADLSCIIVCYLSYVHTLFPAGHIMIVNTFYKGDFII